MKMKQYGLRIESLRREGRIIREIAIEVGMKLTDYRSFFAKLKELAACFAQTASPCG